MRYAVTLRRGGLRQVYDAQYGSKAAAVFGVLRKESAREMVVDARGGRQDYPLEITVRHATGSDLLEGFRERRRTKGCDRVQ